MISEKEATNENSNNKNVDLEYVYMDILNNENPIEAQETIDTNKYLRSNLLFIVFEISF